MDTNKEKKEILTRTKEFSVRVIKLTHYLRKIKVEYFLRDQIGRSGSSIGANIHEAKASSSTREFCRYYEIALRSGYETQYWFSILDQIYNVGEIVAFRHLEQELDSIIRILSFIIIKLKLKLVKEEKVK